MITNKICQLIGFFVAHCLSVHSHAGSFSESETSALSLAGYAKSYGQIDQQGQQQLFIPIRVMANYQTDHQGVNANYQLHYGLTPMVTNKGFSDAFVATENFRVSDPSVILTEPNDHTRVLHNLDRFNVQYQLNQAELTLGRQVVSFGLARFINPTDIVKPYGLLTLDQEYRVGVDGISFRKYLADFSVLNVGWVSMAGGKGWFVKAKHTLDRVDMEWLGFDLPNGSLLGLSVQTSFQNHSIWFESATMLAKEQAFKDYNRTSLGMDMGLLTDSLLSLELHYNQAGSSQTAHYLETVNSLAYQNYGVSLLGQHYVLAAFNYTLNPLWTVAISGYGNLDDHSALLNVLASTSWSDDWYSDVSVDYAASNDTANEFSKALQRITFSLAYYF